MVIQDHKKSLKNTWRTRNFKTVNGIILTSRIMLKINKIVKAKMNLSTMEILMILQENRAQESMS